MAEQTQRMEMRIDPNATMTAFNWQFSRLLLDKLKELVETNRAFTSKPVDKHSIPNSELAIALLSQLNEQLHLREEGVETSSGLSAFIANAEEFLAIFVKQPEPVPTPMQMSAQTEPNGLMMDELERLAILKALEECGGNKTHTAGRLKITVRTLERKLQHYQLEGQNVSVDPGKRDPGSDTKRQHGGCSAECG